MTTIIDLGPSTVDACDRDEDESFILSPARSVAIDGIKYDILSPVERGSRDEWLPDEICKMLDAMDDEDAEETIDCLYQIGQKAAA